jgi:magnesium transporter
MIRYFGTYDGKLDELKQTAKDCWINIYPPFNHEHLKKLAAQYNVPIDFLIDSLDIDERARFEKEDGVSLVVIKTPIANQAGEDQRNAAYITIPIGIVLADDVIITISPYENPVINSFLNNNVKHFNTKNREQFVLQLFERNVFYFLYFLKEINNERNAFERELYSSMRNEELTKLLSIEKSLVYFVTSLRSNELLMLKIQRTDFLRTKSNEDQSEFFEDIVVDNSQALEMANIYTNILSGTMDAFASIISNNLNMVMKRLTSVTIVLMIPTLIASFYGMNVKVPGEGLGGAFYYIMALSVFVSIVLTIVFVRKRWF